MKMLKLILLIVILSFSCDNQSPQKTEITTEVADKKESAKILKKENDRVNGSYEFNIDGKVYKSTQLQDNYCDMSFNYSGEKSFVVIRLKDVNSSDAFILYVYGSETFIENPAGTINNFMGVGNPWGAVSFVSDTNEDGSIGSTSLADGEINITEFEKGKIRADFKGMGGTPLQVATKENLIPFEGKFTLETENISELGKKE